MVSSHHLLLPASRQAQSSVHALAVRELALAAVAPGAANTADKRAMIATAMKCIVR